MPGKVKVKILAGRNLPVMDRSSDTTDAYVEIKLGTTTYKTDVCRKSLHPKWNSDWYRFEVDDAELQDEPLQIRLMDHDTYSANDSIGKVYLDLNPLLLPAANHLSRSGRKGDTPNPDKMPNSVLSGWFPVYDTMHGIRGEVNIIVKVELFTDLNRFRQSSCGVQFFCSPSVPHGYCSQVVHGFVEELIVNDDPEYQWIDKIRTPRASNEARQTLFFKLSRELQRKIGVKTLDLGGNAVIGYRQHFDLEGESGVVARGIGTAVTLAKIVDILHSKIPEEDDVEGDGSPSKQQVEVPDESIKITSPSRVVSAPCISRRSSDSDLSVTPKGTIVNGIPTTKANQIKNTALQDNFDMLEYPFLTMLKYPSQFIIHLGGTVSARSVKLLERISNIDEPESRDTWWSELRMEIRSHARALNCNAVLGYSEVTSICEDVCVLSAYGTAAVIGFQQSDETGSNLHLTPKLRLSNKDIMTTSLDRNDFERIKTEEVQKSVNNSNNNNNLDSPDHVPQVRNMCSICHLPYNTNNVPVRSVQMKCSVCKSAKVPDILLATIEMPDDMPFIGRGCFIQSYVCRQLKDLRGESNAKEISDGLPFLEYEVHRLLVNKLKIKCMNAIFGLKIHITVGEKMLIGMATGTAIFLSALSVPVTPKLISDRPTEKERLNMLQQQIYDVMKQNKEKYRLKDIDENVQNGGRVINSDEEDEDPTSACELSLGRKDCCILEIDDPEDRQVLNLLLEDKPPEGFFVVNTEFVPGLENMEITKNLQMFTQVYRAKLHPPYKLDQYVTRILQVVYFKLRRMIPSALCITQFHVDLPEQDEVQLYVLGVVVGLIDPQKPKPKKHDVKKPDDNLIFDLEDHVSDNTIVTPNRMTSFFKQKIMRNKTCSFKRHILHMERHGVDITPLSFVPGGKIEKYLGNLNFFFIRETTSLREEGGLSSFIHSFVTEVLAVIRAHVNALGGNAMVAYYMTKCELNHNLHKNQGHCLINVGGDVVYVSYVHEDN